MTYNNKAIEDNTQRSEASNNPEVKKILQRIL